jgi:hypothetical protein
VSIRSFHCSIFVYNIVDKIVNSFTSCQIPHYLDSHWGLSRLWIRKKVTIIFTTPPLAENGPAVVIAPAKKPQRPKKPHAWVFGADMGYPLKYYVARNSVEFDDPLLPIQGDGSAVRRYGRASLSGL